MRRPLLLLLLLPQLLGAQATVRRGVAVDPEVALRLWIPAGEVQVTAWDRDSVAVEATTSEGVQLVGGGSRDAAKYAVEFIDRSRTGLPGAKLVVRVPRRARVWIKSTTAAVVVRGTAAELDVLSVTGHVVVRDVTGSTTVEAINAAVDIGGATGAVRVRGGSGPVVLAAISGAIDVTMVSGSVTVAPQATSGHLPGGRVETVGGMVTLSGTLAPGSTLQVDTHDGAILLQVPPGAPPLVRASGVELSLPAALRGRTTSGTVEVRTFSGELNVRVLDGT